MEFADSDDDLEKDTSDGDGSDNEGVDIFSSGAQKKGAKSTGDTLDKRVVAQSIKEKMLEQNESDDDSESDDDDIGSEAGDDSEDEEEDLSSEDDSVNEEGDEHFTDVKKRTSTKAVEKVKRQKSNKKGASAGKGTTAAGTDSGVCSDRDLSSGNEEMETDEGGSDREKDNLDSTEEGQGGSVFINSFDDSMFITI